jgi:hypothetical protein
MEMSRKEIVMKHFVLVRSDAPDHFTAQAVGLPEVRAVGSTEAEAVDQVRRSLNEWLAGAKIVPVEVSVNGGNPWLEFFGRSIDDPDFDDYVRVLEHARQAGSDE